MGKKDLDDVRGDREPRWDIEVQFVEFPKPTYYQLRLFGYVFVFGRHWISAKAAEKDSREKGVKRYPRECTNFDSDKETSTLKNGCPACEAGLTITKHYLVNCIHREKQDQNVKNPVLALGPIPPQVMTDIMGLKFLNKDKNDKSNGDPKHVTNTQFGRDINISYSESRTPKWNVSLGGDGRSPMTEQELAYPIYDFEKLFIPDPSKKDVVEAYNVNTRTGLARGGYFGTTTNGAAAHTEPQEDMKRPAVQAPASVAENAPPPRQMEVVGGNIGSSAAKPTGNQPECPNADQGYRYADYKADKVCNKCPMRGGCISATP